MPTRTILVNGNGTGTLSFQLDGPDITDVEAVLAEIDTSGAGDTLATLTATSPAGSDVAAVPQGQPVSGGGQGRATWALRLAEDAAAAAAAAAMEVFHFVPVFGIVVPPSTTTPLTWVHTAGPFLLNSFGNPLAPTVNAAGDYAVTFQVEHAVAPVTSGTFAARLETVDASAMSVTANGGFADTAAIRSEAGAALVRPMAAGCVLRVNVFHNEAGNRNFGLTATVVKIG